MTAHRTPAGETHATYLGMMSGTSADGVDAVLVDFARDGAFEITAKLFLPYSKTLRQEINELAHHQGPLDADKLAQLDARLAEFYAVAACRLLDENKIDISKVTAIANHGQTIRHEPNATPPSSLQLGDPASIAQRSKIRTIARFRQADLAVGGQGAPLMPAFHGHYFKGNKNRVILNIGGIANITVLSALKGDGVYGFDTGPGNTLLDQWIFKHAGQRYDADGQWASKHQPDARLLNTLLDDPYFDLPYPKSTGPDYFNLIWLEEKIPSLEQYSPGVIQATLLALTSESISRAIISCAPKTKEVLVCGGGAHNAYLMQDLRQKLTGIGATVAATDVLGVPADWVEALGFAWLGYCFDEGIVSNLPDVTGAHAKVVLGEEFRVNASEAPRSS